MNTKAYAAYTATEELAPFEFNRRELTANDVKISIEYCGVCHSDIHMARNDWGMSTYPIVPGHEIVGRVVSVGSDVKNFKEGDLVGVGCMVDSCGVCPACSENEEQHCYEGMVMTYGSEDSVMGGITQGGYSDKIVVDESFVLSVSENLDIKAVAPLLCAGITTYSPLMQWDVKKGDKVGVIGLGGLGHMGIKFAAALGAQVVMITTSEAKAADAKRLGAHEVLISTDEEAMLAQAGTFDFLLNTVPVAHDINPYVALLKYKSTMAIVGAISPLPELDGAGLVMGGKRVVGSLIGGIKQTQEMLDFCAEHNIVSDVEMIDIQDINKAYERIIKADIKYRFVIDMKSLGA